MTAAKRVGYENIRRVYAVAAGPESFSRRESVGRLAGEPCCAAFAPPRGMSPIELLKID
jgi:hypothetical protein